MYQDGHLRPTETYGKPYGTLPTKMSFYYKLCTLVGVSYFRRCCLYLVGRRVFILSTDDVCNLSADDVCILSADDVCNLSADDVISCQPTMFASCRSTMFHLVGRRSFHLVGRRVPSRRRFLQTKIVAAARGRLFKTELSSDLNNNDKTVVMINYALLYCVIALSHMAGETIHKGMVSVG